ncbi:hypothetical protein P5V15_005082, partial [Pogonomyrmex californicus]
MRPGPPVQPSRRRPPRRQHPYHQQQLHRKRNRQQQQQERRRPRPLPQPHSHGSRVLLVLLLLVSNPVVLGQVEPPESPAALAAPATQCQQVVPTVSSVSQKSSLWWGSNDTSSSSVQPRSLTIGYLTAIKGGLKDRQGLAISGALSMALEEVNNDKNILPNVKLVMRWSDTRGETVEATNAMIDMICDGVVAFFGPEGSCYVEAIVAQSRNIPMISYV